MADASTQAQFVSDLYAQQENLLGLIATYQSEITNFQTVITADTAALVTVLANPKPNYNIDGQSVSWGDYTAMLQNSIQSMTNSINLISQSIERTIKTLEQLNRLIVLNQPYQYQSYMN